MPEMRQMHAQNYVVREFMATSAFVGACLGEASLLSFFAPSPTPPPL